VTLSNDALAVAVEVATLHGLRVGSPHVLAKGAALVVALEPARVVVKVARSGLARELAVVRWLAARQLPVVAPAAGMPPIVHRRGGWELTFWQRLAGGPGDPGVAGAALRAIDEALAAYDGDVKRGWSKAPPGLPAVVGETIAAAERAFAGAPLRPQHGDPHDGNWLGGRWLDFEDVRMAPPEWDRACLLFCSEADGDAWAARVAAELPAGDRARTEAAIRLRAASSAIWGASRGDHAHVERRVAWLTARRAATPASCPP